MTPFWLNINDTGWNITERIRLWLDSKDDNLIAWKWQKQPCMALVPLADAPFHVVCKNIVEQIVNAIQEI